MIQYICDECGKPAMQGNSTNVFSEPSTRKDCDKFSWYGCLVATPCKGNYGNEPSAEARTADGHHLCIECAVKFTVRGLARFGVNTSPQKHIEFHNYVWKDGHGTRIEKPTRSCGCAEDEHCTVCDPNGFKSKEKKEGHASRN